MSDWLTPLVDAYRAENLPSSLDARALRTRILQASARRDRSPVRHLKWLVPLAATFLGTVVLAATPVARPFVTHVWAHLAAFVGARPTSCAPAVRRAPLPPPPALTLAPHPDLPRAATVPLDEPAPAPPPAPPFVRESPRVAPRASLGASAPSAVAPRSSASTGAHSADRARSGDAAPSAVTAPPAATAPPPPPVPSPDAALAPDLASYRVAHRLHFADGDYARALVAWNGYLSRFPNGTFAPEARLNRAVCLARLGRTADARTQLRSIAGGKGSYGAQAQRLLDAMAPEQ